LFNVIVFDHSKYQRHAYIFNLCFVVENESQVDCVYEPLVQKCAQYLVQLECECQFLFDQESKKNLLPALLQNIFDGLNGDGMYIIDDGSNYSRSMHNFCHRTDNFASKTESIVSRQRTAKSISAYGANVYTITATSFTCRFAETRRSLAKGMLL
jgi:hypothetical protein